MNYKHFKGLINEILIKGCVLLFGLCDRLPQYLTNQRALSRSLGCSGVAPYEITCEVYPTGFLCLLCLFSIKFPVRVVRWETDTKLGRNGRSS